ncbi:peptidoglycan-recognition protein LC isoform X2 [Teleopsis dalmanni]|uniref:peptidoglycan-recognition protein LC isoform X2 n=1 Tax=Teleopsis dalmanni TaxID=139649 RepID=UPI0018CC9AFA|nr:peptidoglycan-recognition protein LC isoform X2 [Teleopsis dalmanni]
MHLKNDNEMNSNGNHLSAATSCSSSTDSGVIIIDNKTTFNNSNSNSNNNNNSNDNATTTLTTSKIAKDNTNEEAKKNIDNGLHIENEKSSPKLLKNNQNKSDKFNANKNNNLSIENIINITNTPSSDDVEAQKNWQTRSSSRNCSRPNSKHCSPAVSIRSMSISIVSIDENAIDSSIVDSDSECEADAEGVHSNYIVKKLGQQTTLAPDSPDLPNINKGLTVISQRINPNGNLSAGVGPLAENILNGNLQPPGLGALTPVAPPQIGSIALSNSTDVTFGDKHFYEGPVTIQQFLIDNREKWKPTDENGQDNPVFVNENNAKERDNGGPGKEGRTTEAQHQPYKFIFNRKAVIITSAIIVSTILIGILIVATNHWFRSSIRKNKDNLGSGKVLRIVPRDGWLAQPPSKPLLSLNLPVSKVIVSSTDTEDCTTQSTCTYRVRILQTYNIEATHYDDIIYNFLIGGDGNVYEGRGWDNVGAHLKGWNDKSISLAFIGTFKKLEPNEKQMSVSKLLLEEGVRLGKLTEDYKIYGAQKIDPNAGIIAADKLYETFKNWPQWSESPSSTND